jgi:hypothetical protein
MKRQSVLLAGLMLAASIAFHQSAHAQVAWRWFGPKTNDKSASVAATDPRRIAEATVEIAWLADPVTFPYYLEARAVNTQLEVRGYVPNKAIREQALRTAQLYSSLPTFDAMKEHPSLLVRPAAMSAQQLHTSVVSSLKAALPKQHQQLKVSCDADGKVYVSGPVAGYDEKVAVSHALRRLQGVTSVQNLTSLPIELAASPPTLAAKDKLPIIRTSNTVETPIEQPVVLASKSRWLSWPLMRTTKDEPPLLEAYKKIAAPDGPIVIPDVPPKAPEVLPVESPAPRPTASELQAAIGKACKQAQRVTVTFRSPTSVQISIDVRSEHDVLSVAERVLAMPELAELRPELLFKVISQ